MPAPIVLRNLIPPPKKGGEPPRIATRPDLRDGARGMGPIDPGPGPGPDPSNWLSHSQPSRAPSPLLRFTDLISGPATGLGDGLGDGAIVTIWAQGVGDTQGSGKVYFTDYAGTKREAAHIYYWKRADGQLPSGPSRLWYSHLMQEIAFSIPAGSVDGEGQITVETGGKTSNTLPFTVRAGDIKHINPEASSTGTAGTFETPFADWDQAMPNCPAGSTIYVHNYVNGSAETPPLRAYYWNRAQASSTQEAQFAIVAYPGKRPQTYSKQGFEGYNTTAMVVSKIDIHSSSHTSYQNGQFVGLIGMGSQSPGGIRATRWGRAIANKVTEIPGGASTGTSGAIYGTAKYGDTVSNFKMLGNEVHDYGKPQTSALHHTTYMTIRSGIGNFEVEPWEMAFNFLHSNQAKAGLHMFDQNLNSGSPVGVLPIHDNVVVEQSGTGISIGATNQARWLFDCDIYNNVLIDVGRASTWDGVDPTTAQQHQDAAISLRSSADPDGLRGQYSVRDNLAYDWSADQAGVGTEAAVSFESAATNINIDIKSNIFSTAIPYPYVGYGRNTSEADVGPTGDGNLYDFRSEGSGESPPAWDVSARTGSTQITLDGAIVTLNASSVAAGGGTTTGHDIYGVPRNGTIGPVEII